jgi:hypothetical protein
VVSRDGFCISKNAELAHAWFMRLQNETDTAHVSVSLLQNEEWANPWCGSKRRVYSKAPNIAMMSERFRKTNISKIWCRARRCSKNSELQTTCEDGGQRKHSRTTCAGSYKKSIRRMTRWCAAPPQDLLEGYDARLPSLLCSFSAAMGIKRTLFRLPFSSPLVHSKA